MEWNDYDVCLGDVNRQRELLVFIPTYNRPDAIDECLKNLTSSLSSNSLSVWICDSSDNDLTESIAREYVAHFELGVIYTHCVDPGVADLKTVDALVLCRSICRYVWVQSDGILPDYRGVLDEAKPFISQGYDLICLDDIDPFRLGEKQYSECCELLRECIWRILLYGATVVSNKVLQVMSEKALREKYIGTGFGYQMLLMEYVAAADFNAVHVTLDFFKVNERKGRFSEWSSRYLQQWTVQWCSVIDALPAVYDSVKAEAIASHDGATCVLGVINLAKYREANKLTLKQLRSCKESFKRATSTPYFIACFISVLPPRLLTPAWRFRKALHRG